VKGVAADYKFASNMDELTRERGHIHASIVKRPLASHYFASDKNKQWIVL